MNYENIEEAGVLSIYFNGNKLDLYSLAIFQINLQEIVDEVSNSYLQGMIKTLENGRRNKKRFLFSNYSDSRIIRSEIRHIGSDSLTQEIGFQVSSVLADADVRAVLNGLASGIIFAILSCGVKGIFKKKKKRPERFAYVPNVGENVRPIVQILSQNGGGKLTFKSKIDNEVEEIVEIEINSNY